MVLVLPEVVVKTVEHAADERNLFVALHDLEQAAVQGRVRRLADPIDSLRIALLHPADLLITLDVLEPLAWVGEVCQCRQRGIGRTHVNAAGGSRKRPMRTQEQGIRR